MNSALRAVRQPRLAQGRPSVRTFTSSSSRPANAVRIVEVGARDGLQNEKTTISLETKLELIRRLARTGVRDIEAGSFVAPKWVPQVCFMRAEQCRMLMSKDGEFGRCHEANS